MQKTNLNLSKGYSSQYNEITLDNLRVDGEIPKWLSGSFLSNGPAQFEVGNTTFNHWFDGFAMLKKFHFKSGAISFQNRFLKSKKYIESNALGKLSGNEFGTYANKSVLGRIKSSISGSLKRKPNDNCDVNTTCIANNYIAMTESKNLVSFNLSDLSTTGAFHFSDEIPGHLSTAHPHFDINTGEFINVSIEIGKVAQYHLYRVEPMSKTRKLIHTYVSDTLFYIHSFSITKNYIILFKTPLVMNQHKLLLGLPFNHTLSYQKKLASFFVIIDRRSGTTYEVEGDSFVCLHSVNAYEQEKEIILDLVCYQAGNPYDQLGLANLKSNQPVLPMGEIRRYIIDLSSKKCRPITLSSGAHEFPRINYEIGNGHPYHFIYTSSLNQAEEPFFNAIQKLNTQTGNSQRWSKPNGCLGEPIFVAKERSSLEDDGVLLSIAFDKLTQLSSLIILDANSMNQLAEVFLPIHLPFGLHGNFYKTN